MTGVRAISTKTGLVLSLTKHAIKKMKDCGELSIDLVTGTTKLHVKLMRDTTYRARERERLKDAEEQQDTQKQIRDLAKDLDN